MNRADFKAFLSQYEQFYTNCDKLYHIGIRLVSGESEYPIQDYCDKMFDIVVASTYNDFGVEWINWFVFDCDFGKKIKGAWDGYNLICQTLDELLDYVEQYRKDA